VSEVNSRIGVASNDINRHPVVHTWSYKLDQPLEMIRTMETFA
jgi:hypothetical protein